MSQLASAPPSAPFPHHYVEVAVSLPLAVGIFHYHLPAEFIGKVSAGCLVVVPFGSQKIQGVVLRQIAQADVPETRPVSELIDDRPVLTAAQIELARWMAETSYSPLAASIDRMLPPGLSQRADTVFHLLANGANLPELDTLQGRLLALLRKRGDLRGQQIDRALKHRNWRSAAQALVRRGLVQTFSLLPPPSVRPKLVRTVQLSCSPQAAQDALPILARSGSAALKRRQALLHFLLREPWEVDVAWAYAQSGANLADLQALAEKGLVALGETEVWRDPLSEVEVVREHSLSLTTDQDQVWRMLKVGLECAASGEAVQPFLLHGVTGSGKTEIYLQAVRETLRLGRQAIVLVPEIALTPQTVRRFINRFPGQVGLVHSRLSEGERYDTWRRARAGMLQVIVGPRSALFTPLPNLGLIVVDECHDESYYQSESQPYYHAADTALAYARFAKAVCLLGSATPDIALRYQAERERWQYLELPRRVAAHRQITAPDRNQPVGMTDKTHLVGVDVPDAAPHLPEVNIVDMRQELKAGNRSIFSRALLGALHQVLDAGHQAILFLNRRGTATFVFCRSCGASLHCPRCDIPLTYHSSPPRLICHYCAYRRQMPTRCPDCSSTQMRQYGAGTEKVEAQVAELFPQARVLRWDAETTRERGSHEIILAHFAAHRADVLVGTQMLAKGLDLPLVTLVGAVLADVGLNLPDFRASERTFQVLTQVAGRAGRSPLGGQVILQTFQPEHYAIQAAARHDYVAFYNQELSYRRSLRYPPFYRLLRLEYRHRQEGRAEAAALALAEQIRVWLASGDHRATEMIGPVPCFFGQLHGIYRWQIILRGPDPLSLLQGRSMGEWRVEVDPPNLL